MALLTPSASTHRETSRPRRPARTRAPHAAAGGRDATGSERRYASSRAPHRSHLGQGPPSPTAPAARGPRRTVTETQPPQPSPPPAAPQSRRRPRSQLGADRPAGFGAAPHADGSPGCGARPRTATSQPAHHPAPDQAAATPPKTSQPAHRSPHQDDRSAARCTPGPERGTGHTAPRTGDGAQPHPDPARLSRPYQGRCPAPHRAFHGQSSRPRALPCYHDEMSKPGSARR